MKLEEERKFDKYTKRGSVHWKEIMSKDIRVFNSYHKARYGWILKTAGDIKGKKVLDLGCGDGVLTYFLAKAGARVTGVDNDETGLQYANEKLSEFNKAKNLTYTFVNASVYDLPFEADTFDVVVNCEVIEHLPEPERMLREMKRVLKPQGRVVITTPHRLTEVPQDPNHVKEYFPTELKDMISSYFNSIEIKLTHHMLWRSIYGYGFTHFGNRNLGRWFLNIFTLLFGWNPFMIDYAKPKKFDTFSSICVWGNK